METRILNYRSTWPLQMNEQVASNYYPMTFSAYIENSVQRLSIVTDRARGCSSMNSGQLETMLHRRYVALFRFCRFSSFSLFSFFLLFFFFGFFLFASFLFSSLSFRFVFSSLLVC